MKTHEELMKSAEDKLKEVKDQYGDRYYSMEELISLQCVDGEEGVDGCYCKDCK